LNGGAIPKPPAVVDAPQSQPPPREGTAAQIGAGEVLFNRFCARCHVFGLGILPDLRHMSPATHQLFYSIVLNGAYQAKGMARWDDVVSRPDAEAIHAYLTDQAWLAQAPAAPALQH
jgi:quinohemoprotein ethanol dehydrogenase